MNAERKVPREAGERTAYPDVDTRTGVIGPDRKVDKEVVVRRVPPCTVAFIMKWLNDSTLCAISEQVKKVC
jgi:hypothetical protein